MSERSIPPPERQKHSSPNDNEKLKSEAIKALPGELPGRDAAALAVNMAAFDGKSQLVVGKPEQAKPERTKPEQTRETNRPRLSDEQRRDLVKELDSLGKDKADAPRKFDILTTLGKDCARSGENRPSDQTMARYYLDSALEVGEANQIAPSEMRDLYKFTADFLMQHKTKRDDHNNLVPDKDRVMAYLDKAIDLSEKVFKEIGSGNAERHAQLLEYKARLQQSFGSPTDHDDAIMSYLRARNVREVHKVPESHESAMAATSMANSFEPRRGLNPLPSYLKALEIAAAAPGENLMPYVDKYVDALKRSPIGYRHAEDHQKLVDSLKEVVRIAEGKYGPNSEQMVPVLEKVASLCITDPQLPSKIKSQYAIEVLEKTYALQKSPEERIKTLGLLGDETAAVVSKQAAAVIFNKMIKEAETAFGKDDPRMIPALSKMARSYYGMSDYAQSIGVLEQVYKLQTAANVDPEKRIDTLLRISEMSAYGKEGGRQKAIQKFEEALALGEKSFPKNSPKYEDSLQNIARRIQYSGLHEQSASLLEKVYDIQTTQNRDVKDRLATLQRISEHYFSAKDFGKGAKTFDQIIELAKNNKDLKSFVELPSYLRSAVHIADSRTGRDKSDKGAETKTTNDLFAVGKTLRKAGEVLDGWGLHSLAFENYNAAVEAFDRCLTRGIENKSETLSTILSISDVELKHDPIPENETDEQRAHRDRQQQSREQYGWELEGLHRNAVELVNQDKNNQDPHLIDVLDKITKFYFAHQHYSQARPLLEKSLSLAKSQKRPLEEIGERATKLAYTQAVGTKPAEATETYKDLIKYAQEVAGDKPNVTSMHALNNLSRHLQYYDRRVDHIEQALIAKQQELEMARALKIPNKEMATLIHEKGKFQVQLGDNKSALATMEEALKLNENILESPEFTRDLTRLYGENQQSQQMEGLLRRTVVVRKAHDSYNSLTDSSLDLANLLKQQNNPDRLKEAVQIVEQARDMLLPKLEAAKNSASNHDGLTYDLASTLSWLAPYYENQKNMALAEKTYKDCCEALRYIQKSGDSPARLKTALKGLIRVYKAQGKLDEAGDAQEDLDALK